MKNPSAADKRKLTSSAKELNSANTITGDPTLSGSAGGAILTIIANGTNPTTQDFDSAAGHVGEPASPSGGQRHVRASSTRTAAASRAR